MVLDIMITLGLKFINNSRRIFHDKTTFPRIRKVEKNIRMQSKKHTHIPRKRNVQGGHEKCRVRKLELEN